MFSFFSPFYPLYSFWVVIMKLFFQDILKWVQCSKLYFDIIGIRLWIIIFMKSITLYFILLITYSWSISCVQDDMFDISQKSLTIYHCVKRVRIRSYSGSYFSRIRTEYGELRSISTYAIQMRENTNQNNSEYGHFLRSVCNFWHKYLENSVMFTQRLKWMSGPSLPLKTESWKVLTFIRYGIYSSSFIFKRLWL